MSLTKVSYSMIGGAPINVLDYGAVGDGVANDTAAIQAAINANLSGGEIYFPPGTYKITSTLNKPMSFVGPSLIGAGFDQTIFDYSTLATEQACLYIQGGSGALASIVVSNIQFQGNRAGASNGTAGIRIDGQCGVLIQKCKFDKNKYGVHFNNKTAGSFTEFCVAENCQFTVECGVDLYYSKDAGNNSFHGSGARGCTFNKDTAVNNYPCVVVEDGCLVYNAPLSVQIWAAGSSSVVGIRNNNTGVLNCNWYGNLTLESFGASSPITLADSTGRSFYVGGVSSLNQYWGRNTLILCSSFSGRSSGEGDGTILPMTVSQSNVVNGTAITFNPIWGPGGAFAQYSQSYLLQIRLIGASYQYAHICVVSYAAGAGGSDIITQLAAQQTFNTAGWGASTFSINGSGQLVVTNASGGFSVTAYVGVTPIGAAFTN